MECILKEKFCREQGNCYICNSRAKNLSQEVKYDPKLCAWINCNFNYDFICENKKIKNNEVPEGRSCKLYEIPEFLK